MTRRGTTNTNDRGNVHDRRRRREWLVETYRADFDAFVYKGVITGAVKRGDGQPACRCYRCGELLTVETVTVDRRVPGIEGGTYDKSNIRPACGPCNSSTGGVLGAERKAAMAS
jgi:hypothetical protein